MSQLVDTRYLSAKPFLLEPSIAAPCAVCRHVSLSGRCLKALAPRYSSIVDNELGCSEHTSLRRKLVVAQ